MILYINACVRKESRTDRLARCLIEKLGGSFTEVKTENADIRPLSEEKLAERTEYIAKSDYSDAMFDYAKQFASADTIVIAAPYWDLSFPASLKAYIENIFITGLTFRYTEEGIPVGMCKAKKLYYVTTAGGPYNQSFSFDYIKSAADMLGIKETELIKAEMLDVVGFDSKKILADAIENINNII